MKKNLGSVNQNLSKELQKKILYLQQLEDELYLKENLPHLYGYRFYPWQEEFINTKNKTAILTASNQCGKSFTQSIRMLRLITNPESWNNWFSRKPDCFWFLLPSKEMIESMIDVKWAPLLLPRGRFENDERFGWKIKKSHGYYNYIKFNTGIFLYLKSYEQGVEKLQSGSCDYIGLDEEIDADLIPELNARRMATNGYLSAVLTPTKGQEIWRCALEENGDKETFKGAWKRNISLYDCQHYSDGTPSHWTDERIQEVINSCVTNEEVQRRVYGKFVKTEGLMFPQFSREHNVKPYHPLKLETGYVYAGLDSGSGDTGPSSHPAAITFIWINKDQNKIRVFKHWRSPKGVAIEPREILEKYIEMRGSISMSGEFYDWHAKDLQIIGQRLGISLLPADKARERGRDMMNLLFKTRALQIFDLPECEPLINELCNLDVNTPKRMAEDDSIDSLRYAITKSIINWKKVTEIKVRFEEKTTDNKFIDMRMNPPDDIIDTAQTEFESEINFWNKMYEGL